MPLFDGYVAVDWSAAAGRARKRDRRNSIWIATIIGGQARPLENPDTRHEAMQHIQCILNLAKGQSLRLLCGFDFPFGYPDATARMLTGHDGWEALWQLIDEVIHDADNNDNDRFKAAARLNTRFQGEGPFWGRPETTVIPGLETSVPHNRWGVNLPPYRRHIERLFPCEAVWRLYGDPSVVGSQALTGIARLNHLRKRDDVQIWPFETLGEGRHHVLAEIYPSLIEPAPEEDVPDAGQVKAVVNRLQELDLAGRLLGRLRAPNQMPASVGIEEGLFLDIT